VPVDVTPSVPRPGVVRPVLPTAAGSAALVPVALAWVVPTRVVPTRTGQASIGLVPVVPASTHLILVVLASAAPGSRGRARS